MKEKKKRNCSNLHDYKYIKEFTYYMWAISECVSLAHCTLNQVQKDMSERLIYVPHIMWFSGNVSTLFFILHNHHSGRRTCHKLNKILPDFEGYIRIKGERDRETNQNETYKTYIKIHLRIDLMVWWPPRLVSKINNYGTKHM